MTAESTRDLVIRFSGVSKSFGNGALDVLDGIDLTVSRGAFVSVLGPSGCGKSTLLNIAAGIEDPTSGSVDVDGNPDRIGRSSHMPQRDLLMPWKRLVDNVAVGLVAKGESRSAARDAARELLNRFGLAGFADSYPGELSGGMRRRAAIARTFLAGPDILLLDEPFAALDSLSKLDMQTWLLDIWRDFGASILFVTHDIEEALRLSDRVYVLSARPATVAGQISVDLPRPRRYEMVLSPDFIRLKETALHHLRRTAGPS